MKRESRLLFLQAMVVAAGMLMASRATHAQVTLADAPVFTSVSVPGNLALALSVEFPTAISVAHSNRTYSSANTYIGYFDPSKCYAYRYTDGTGTDNYFYPASVANNHACSGQWSGNYLNWAAMQTIDPFRWALTGGYRLIDTSSLTVLEKAWGSNQGSTSNFPDSSVSGSTTVAGATPFGTASGIATRIWSLGNKMRFMTATSGVPAPNYTNPVTPYNPGASYNNGTLYEVFIRVKVCDPTSSVGGLESNCAVYGSGSSASYKPTGLMQQYSDKIRFSAFGYLNDSNLQRDGGVMRARQKFVGPTMPVPGSNPVTNPKAEWDPATGIFIANPDAADATATTTATGVTVSNSGVINYLNKFGEPSPGPGSGVYKTYDNVSEMYYAVQRYYRNIGGVAAWTSMSGATTAQKTTFVDGFPVITNWDDPIQYSCQRNFILGIGDVNTHADRNLPGATGVKEPAKPIEVSNDTTMNTVDWTNQVGVLQGMGSSLGTLQGINTPSCCNYNGALMAGLAYWANVSDIRPDLPGIQSIQTYWLDVMEFQVFKTNNQFYLTAKYGGFNPPASFTPATATASQFANNASTKSWWSTTTDVMPDGSPRPDNFYTAGQASLMVNGLAKAFSSIATKLAAYSTSFSTSQPQVSTLGVSTYAAKYDSKYWTGDVIASQTSFDPNSGAPTSTAQWSLSTTLMTQAAGTGWNGGRNIVTYNPSTQAGVTFRTASLATSQVTALTPAYGSGNTAATLLNYIRGERSNEASSTASGSTHAYRDRANLLGDIVNAKTVPVGPPAFPYSAAFNPGYDTFKSTYANRAPMVYAAANDGMLHAIDGSLTSTPLSGSSPGNELWAYIPNAVINGPTGAPSTDGLASLGNPSFVHHYMVDATPTMADVDFGRTSGGSGTADWRTLLIGGLGKGGKALYALDITNPASVTSEGAAAQKVLWEFTDSALGFTYGQPIVTKTRKYGWVVIAGSGYNNSDGKGYFFFINPRTGALLEKIAVPCAPACSSTNQSGMAHINAFVLNGADGYADAVYGGDLLGNIWRLDVTGGSGGYPTPVRFASLTSSDSNNSPLPITTKPLPVVQPHTNLRFVTVGTGRMLSTNDTSSAQPQRFFSILDGTNAAFSQDGSVSGTVSSLPTGVTFPITVAQLAARTSLTTQTLLDLRTQLGWYVDLGVASGGSAWRVLTDPTSFYGSVAFAATSPTSTDACSPDGKSQVYVLDLGSGYCGLNTTDNTCYVGNFTGVITDLRFISRNVNGVGKLSLIGGTSTGGLLNPQLKQSNPIGIKRLSVREIIVN